MCETWGRICTRIGGMLMPVRILIRIWIAIKMEIRIRIRIGIKQSRYTTLPKKWKLFKPILVGKVFNRLSSVGIEAAVKARRDQVNICCEIQVTVRQF
jgi:hypothetical protein